MKLIELDGYSINPASVAYVTTRHVTGHRPREQYAVIFFIGGTELHIDSLSQFECVKKLNEAEE